MRGLLKSCLAALTAAILLLGTVAVFADSDQFKLDMLMAKRGDADAQYYIGIGYEEGRGTGKDVKKAFKWYSQAANQGHHGAQFKMGTFYEYGYGVTKNIQTAIEWYKKAAKNGSKPAKERLNKAAFARSEQVMKRRIAAMREEQDKAAGKKRRQENVRAARLEKKQLTKKKAATKVARKDSKAAVPDIMSVVLRNKWSNAGSPADQLPSSHTNCLKSSDREVVCFSREMSRHVNGANVIYTGKATLSNFNRRGSFKIKYFYNALKVEDEGGKGPRVDPQGLRAEEGWQEPQLSMSCHATDRSTLVCSRANHKIQYTR